MSGIDLVILGIFLISILVGIMRGLIKEALSIVSWVAAIWLAITYNVAAGEWFSQFMNIPNEKFRTWIGFVLVFIVTLFLFSIINFAITKLIVRGPIKATDRVLGIFFGAARAGLIVVAFVIVLRGLGLAESEWWQESSLIPHFVPAADVIEPLVFDSLPESARDEDSLERRLLDQAVENISDSEPAELESQE